MGGPVGGCNARRECGRSHLWDTAACARAASARQPWQKPPPKAEISPDRGTSTSCFLDRLLSTYFPAGMDLVPPPPPMTK